MRFRQIQKCAQVSCLISDTQVHRSQFCLIPKLGIFPAHAPASKFLDSMSPQGKTASEGTGGKDVGGCNGMKLLSWIFGLLGGKEMDWELSVPKVFIQAKKGESRPQEVGPRALYGFCSWPICGLGEGALHSGMQYSWG